MQNALILKKKEMEDFQLNHLQDNNLEFEKVKIQNKLELGYAQEIEGKDSMIEQLRTSIDTLEKDNKVMAARLINYSGDKQSSMDSLKKSHRAQVDALMEEIADLQEKVSFNRSEEELRELRIKEENSRNQIKLLNQEIEQLTEDNDSLGQQKHSATLEKLRNEEKLRETLGELQVEGDRLAVQNDLMNKENTEVYTNLKRIEGRCFELVNQKNELEGVLELKQKEIDELEDQLIRQTEVHKTELSQKEQRINTRERDVDSQAFEIKETLEKVQRDKQTKDKSNFQKIENLTKELNFSDSKLNQSKQRVRELQDQVESYNTALASQKSLVDRLSNDKQRILEDYKTCQTKVTLLNNENKELNEYVSKKKIQLAMNDNDEIEKLSKEKRVVVGQLGDQLEKYKNQNLKLRKTVKILNKKLVDAVTAKMLSIANSTLNKDPNGGTTRSFYTNIENNVSEQYAHQHQDVNVEHHSKKRVHFDEPSISAGPIYTDETGTIQDVQQMEGYRSAQPIILPTEYIKKQKHDSRSITSDISRPIMTGMSYHQNYPNLQRMEGESRPSASDGFQREVISSGDFGVSPYSTQQEGFQMQRTTSTFGGMNQTSDQLMGQPSVIQEEVGLTSTERERMPTFNPSTASYQSHQNRVEQMSEEELKNRINSLMVEGSSFFQVE